MITSTAKPYTVLYLGSLTHSDDTNFLDKTKPHQDQIDFQNPVKISLIRIPRPGKDIYSRHISITQSQTIKNFEIYYRNIQKTNGRYCLLTSNNELLASSTDDILITPKQPIFTDLLLIKGNFTKITFCIYGNILHELSFINEKCPNYRSNAPIEPLNQNLIQMYANFHDIRKKDIFEQKREIIREIQRDIDSQNNVNQWPSIVNDDGINEQQIENICNLSQKLLTTFTSQQLSQESFVVEFRSGLQQISANLTKIFKNKHLGLYYPSYEDLAIVNEIPFHVTSLALSSLDLSLSQQFRGLEILKFTLQLDRHAEFFIQNQGVQKLVKVFVDFFKLNTVVLSTYRNLILEVFISISHWKKTAEKLTQLLKDKSYYELFQEIVIKQREKISQDRQRSRQKKHKNSRSKSDDQASSDDDKKRKKDKQKKRNRSKEKKKGKQSKSKQQISRKAQQPDQFRLQKQKITSLNEQLPNLSFYEVLLFELSRQTNSKQLLLIKILLQQILQTVTKSKMASQRVALSTSLLKDLKYIFNPLGQVLNTKSLKQFASCYQPFLNNIQSQGVEDQIVSEKEKLKDMKKYHISPKICKIINKISLQIASSQSQENPDESKTPFDQSFIVLMSELIRNKQKSVLYGFGRILTTFKIGSSNDIIYLKKVEAAMTMISQYIYKILVQDTGLYTVLNIDQIYASLINITNCLSKDPSAFTKQLKRKIKQLTNYAMAYDLFNRSEGNFKTISDYFLRLFKFQHYEINKISDFKKKEFDKLIKPLTVSNLSQSVNLGNFQQLFPEQPLLQIDVYLKIFIILLQYNKNVWTLFYQNKLLCGFSFLYTKITNMVIFLLEPSLQRQTHLLVTKKTQLTVENYLNVLHRLLHLLAKNAEYQSAFNELMDEDNFESVELYEKSFQLYTTLFNSLNNSSSLLSEKSKQLAQMNLSLILQIYDKLLESYQLTSHASRQTKIKELWHIIYETHFVNLKSRAACLSLYAFFIETMENASIKLFNTYCIEEHPKIDTQNQNMIKGYLPKNQKSMIENLIVSNIFRSDSVIQKNVSLIIQNLIQKHSQKNPTCEKITPFLQDIFDSIQQKIKEKGNYNFEYKKQLINIEKMTLLTDILKNLNCSLASKFQQKLLKFIKVLDSIKKQAISQQNQFQKSAYKLSLKIKTNIILFLKKSFAQKSENSQILYFIQLLNKNLEIPTRIFNAIQQKELNLLSTQEIMIEKQILNLINSSLDVVCSFSSNPYNQSVLLYEVFLEKPYKPVPQLSLASLFGKICSSQISQFILSQQNEVVCLKTKNTLNSSGNFQLQVKQLLKQILVRISYFVCELTSIESNQFYSTQSRRNAIICLLTQEKQFPFHKFEQFRSFIPRQFLQTFRDYYAYPIIEKSLSLMIDEKKQLIKSKGYIFSKSVFAIIMEGQPTAKARYPYIGGPWKGGDINSKALYTPIRERQYLKIVQKSSNLFNANQYLSQECFKNTIKVLKQKYYQLQLFELSTKKRTKNLQKKTFGDTQIKLLNIPLVLENQNINYRVEQNQMLKKISPSPSNRYPNSGYSKSGQNQYERIIRKVSPSPPTNKIPPTTMIGFNNPGGQNLQPYNSQNTQGLSQQSSSYKPLQPLQPYGSRNLNASSNQISAQSSPQKIQAQYAQYPNPISSVTEPPIYPNPYYGGNNQLKPLTQTQFGQTNSNLPPYLQMQKSASMQVPNGNQIRGPSNSAPRQSNSYTPGMPQESMPGMSQIVGTGMPQGIPSRVNSGQPPVVYNQVMTQGAPLGMTQGVPHGTNYPQQTYSYNQPSYMNANQPKIYDHRSQSPYQKNYPMENQTSNYLQNPRYNSANLPNVSNSYYQTTGIGNSYGSYPQNNIMGNNTRGNYQAMGGNRAYNHQSSHQSSQYGNYNSYGNNNYSSNPSYQNNQNNAYAQQERQFNEAILLVTQLRGTLPEHLKTDKKNRLNQILNTNPKIQIRVKQYIANLK